VIEMPNVMQQILIMNIETLLKEYAVYRAFNKSDCVINMRIPKPILDKIKELADAQHVPYQSLISSVLYSLANIPESETKGGHV
jgi:predicted DNA binding CopG/RHH family protein